MTNPQYLPESALYPQSKYVREVRPQLPADAFQPATSRLAFVPAYLAIVVTASLAIAFGWVPWFLYPVLAIVIGVGFSCLTFIAHEALHGGIVRNKPLKYVLGFIGFFPFMVSPRLWVAWHDRVHHANANLTDDPDMYPTLETYNTDTQIRWFVNAFSLGGRRKRGILSLIFGFTVQGANQSFNATTRGFLSRRERWFALAESASSLVFWATVAALVGFVPFVFIYVMPLLIANLMVMSFILTNHSLSPRVAINDPLVSGLSVTSPRWFDWLTLGFGYHVEHHLFPSMSSRHAPLVRDVLQARFPDRYQSMPLVDALRELHRTARVYKDAVTLVDPRTGQEYPTLLPELARQAQLAA
ncbi:MAG: fatty acid desaturase [Kofleriaceae bacterium]